MSDLDFENEAEYVGSRGEYDWFKWRLFLDEPTAELDEVDSVEHRLHETFPNPDRLVRDPNSQFALQSSGWGEFPVHITVHLRDGGEIHTQYDLDLAQAYEEEDTED